MIKVFKEKFNNHEGYLAKKPRKEGGDVSLHVRINCNTPLAPSTVLGESEWKEEEKEKLLYLPLMHPELLPCHGPIFFGTVTLSFTENYSAGGRIW